MGKPTTLALAGIATALAVFAVGFANTHRLSQSAGRATELCDSSAIVTDLNDVYDALRKADAAGNTKDAQALADYIRSQDTLRVRCKEAAVAATAVERSTHWPLEVALVLVGATTLPWFWYFLLRRIAELRDAITGSSRRP